MLREEPGQYLLEESPFVSRLLFIQIPVYVKRETAADHVNLYHIGIDNDDFVEDGICSVVGRITIVSVFGVAIGFGAIG